MEFLEMKNNWMAQIREENVSKLEDTAIATIPRGTRGKSKTGGTEQSCRGAEAKPGESTKHPGSRGGEQREPGEGKIAEMTARHFSTPLQFLLVFIFLFLNNFNILIATSRLLRFRYYLLTPYHGNGISFCPRPAFPAHTPMCTCTDRPLPRVGVSQGFGACFSALWDPVFFTIVPHTFAFLCNFLVFMGLIFALFFTRLGF